MDSKIINIQTISPIYIPIALKTGTDRASENYQNFITQLVTEHDTVQLTEQVKSNNEYEAIDKDSWEHRLFIWQNEEIAPHLTIHVFPNNIGIVVINHKCDNNNDVKMLESEAQTQAKMLINKVYKNFTDDISTICNEPTCDYFKLLKPDNNKTKIFWVSRALLINSASLSCSNSQQLITQWLAHTYRPEDAKDIISGQLNYSLSWLNYVVIDAKASNDDRLEAMILAQYYYTAQEHCNMQLKQAIDSAYNGNKSNNGQEKLARSRVNTRMHQIDYHEHLKYLTRNKRQILEQILSCWNFEQLTTNGQRMIEICSSKLEETENAKRERSSLLTDLLLVALSFFTVFELSLYLTELSREMMSRPTLDFNDDSRSFMLQFIADIDTDVMFGSGFFLTLLLVFLYKFIKSR